MAGENIDNYIESNRTNYMLEPKNTRIALFRVDYVRPEERSVDIEYIHSNIKEKRVNYMSPFLNTNSGIDFSPSVGDIGVIASTAVNGRIILGFLSSSERSSGMKLLNNELLLKSTLGAVTKLDNGGNIIIVTEGGSGVFLGQDGKYMTFAKSSESKSDAIEEFSGVDEDGNFKYLKKFYDNSRELDFENIDSLIEDLLTEEVPTLKDRSPIAEISAITKIKEDGTEQRIDINFDESDDVVAYSISIKNKDSGNEISSLTFDKSGNIEIKGNKLIFKVSDIIHK